MLDSNLIHVVMYLPNWFIGYSNRDAAMVALDTTLGDVGSTIQGVQLLNCCAQVLIPAAVINEDRRQLLMNEMDGLLEENSQLLGDLQLKVSLHDSVADKLCTETVS